MKIDIIQIIEELMKHGWDLKIETESTDNIYRYKIFAHYSASIYFYKEGASFLRTLNEIIKRIAKEYPHEQFVKWWNEQKEQSK